jgi:GGDEF domain-containing protein
MGAGDEGTLALVLLDADYANSTKVIERLLQRIDNYDFPAPLRISMGAACYPTHGVDADSLRQKAITHPVVSWRSNPPSETRH